MQELRFWVPGWLVSLPLTQAVAHLPPPLPFLSVPPVLSYWPTPYRKQEQKQNNDHHRRNEGAHTAQQPTEEASSIACCPERNAPGSRFTPRPWAEQNPAAPPPGRYHTQSAPSLTRGLPWHSQRLGNVPSPRSLRVPGLSLLSLLPLISWGASWAQRCGNLGWGAEGTAMEVWGKPRRVGNKYESLWQLCFPWVEWGGSRQVWRAAGECGGVDRPAGGECEPRSGVASYHAGVGLGSTGWLIAPDGRGQHRVRLHKSPSVDQAGR